MPAAEEEDRNLFGEEDDDDDGFDDEIDDEEDEDLEPDPKTLKRKSEAENDLNFPSPSTSASSHENPLIPQIPNPNPNFPSAGIAGSGLPPSSPDYKRQKIAAAGADDSRRIFQRLWTDEDEIGLLEGFLDYSSRRGRNTNHDTGPFYDQIKTRLQLDFNKNQLVEKLRRLKKKYRNVVKRMASGKDFSFKSPHDQATFELSSKIWSNAPRSAANDDGDRDRNGHLNFSEVKVPRQRQQSRKNSDDVPPPPAAPPAVEENLPESESPQRTAPVAPPVSMSVPNVIEDTVRSCLSPLFKELLYCAISGPSNSAVGGVALNPLPLNFGGNSVNLSSSEAADERWRKQQILELEVYSKRLELVQEQIKSALEELRSMGS